MKKFRNKYRIPSARASWWDYGNDAAYFITICTKGMECYFGDIVNELVSKARKQRKYHKFSQIRFGN